MTLISPYLSIITSNITGSNSEIKRPNAWVDEKNTKSQQYAAYREVILAL